MELGTRAIHWVEEYCIIPNGPDRAKCVRLSEHERHVVSAIFDEPDGRQQNIRGHLAAYIALLSIAGPEALRRLSPDVSVDPFTLWSAVGEELKPFLHRDAGYISVPALGTCSHRWPHSMNAYTQPHTDVPPDKPSLSEVDKPKGYETLAELISALIDHEHRLRREHDASPPPGFR